MPDVIDLATARQERSPHIQNAVRCLRCGHQWRQVQPAGDTVKDIECPSCHGMTGTMVYLVPPMVGTRYMVCHCGNELFVVTSARQAHCVNCGQSHPLPTV